MVFDESLIDDYADLRTRNFFRRLKTDDQRWHMHQAISTIRQHLPQLDFYTEGLDDPKNNYEKSNMYINFGVKKSWDRQASKKFFEFRFRDGQAVLYPRIQTSQFQAWQYYPLDVFLKHSDCHSLIDHINSDAVYVNGCGQTPLMFEQAYQQRVIQISDDSVMVQDDINIKAQPHRAANTIFYGAAGTGKTYQLQQLRQHYTEQLIQQDHATFLAEKLRDLTWRDVICLVFLDEQRLLRVPEIVGHPYFRAKVTTSNRTDNINQTVWGTLMRHTPAESTTVKYALKRRADLALFDKDDAGLWHLLDPQDDQLKELYALLTTLKRGAQPTETIERMSFVTFHQSYGYEDFIEGLRPVLNDDSDDGQVRYEIRRGVFVALCERARRDPEHGYAMLIDEINRGNVSKILGELITLIELDKREGAPNAIRVRLPYSGDWFSVPANVSIYGSMNSADRSLTPLDTALRRRFEFVEIMPDSTLLAGRVIEGVALDELLTVINARIELLLGRDCLLGHAYFYPVQCFADLQAVMQQKIVPQLQEYFFDDWRKIRWVLNDHRKPAALQLIHEHDPQAQMLALFGEELDVPMQPTYTLNSSAFAQIDSYRMILSV